MVTPKRRWIYNFMVHFNNIIKKRSKSVRIKSNEHNKHNIVYIDLWLIM